jgi:hypothetical protein
MKPIITIGKLHFDDLEPKRFEDLSLALLFKLRRWADIQNNGRKGDDDGIDISAIEEIENGVRRTWFVQCKRYLSITKCELKSIVDKILSNNNAIPDILLLIISCDLSKNKIEYFQDYCIIKGIKNPQLWTASILEAKLLAEYHDLLFAYFGVNLNMEKNNRIATIRRNIKLKKRMINDFANEKCYHVIIRSIDDMSYPEVDDSKVGISSWFKVDFKDFYHNGIEVVLRMEEGIFDNKGYWDIVESKDTISKGKYSTGNILIVGRIPYVNIIDYDIDGDGFYRCPHIYCDFNNSGQPYEDIVHYHLTSDYNQHAYCPSLENRFRMKQE